MAVNPVKKVTPGRSGGGSAGGVIGGIGAILAAPFTAGASLALLPAAMTAGQVVGGLADGGSAGKSGPTVPTQDPMQRRIASAEPPEVPHSAILEDSLKALHESGDRELQDKYGQPLFDAYTMSKKKGAVA